MLLLNWTAPLQDLGLLIFPLVLSLLPVPPFDLADDLLTCPKALLSQLRPSPLHSALFICLPLVTRSRPLHIWLVHKSPFLLLALTVLIPRLLSYAYR